MDDSIRQTFEVLRSNDRDAQNRAYYAAIQMTDEPVDWAYEVWDQLVPMLRDKDNHQRAIAAQVLANLAKSDPDNQMGRDFPALLAVTRDERFVTARHALQSLWKVGLAGAAQQQMVVAGLTERYHACSAEKNGTLIRYDIIDDLKKLYDATADETIRETALALIETEQDLKYRKKYAILWRKKIATPA